MVPSPSWPLSLWPQHQTEPSARYDSQGIQLSAKRDGSDYVLNGKKLFIRDSHVADMLIVVARTSGNGDDGVSLFAVNGGAPGISQDGSIIAFASKDDPLGTNPDGNSEIFLFNGTTLRQITNTTPATITAPSRRSPTRPRW